LSRTRIGNTNGDLVPRFLHFMAGCYADPSRSRCFTFSWKL